MKSVFSVLLALAAVTGCYTGGGITSSGTDSFAKPTTALAATEPASAASFEGLPCGVAAMLAAKCSSCHGQLLAGGAPSSLTSYAELTAASANDPSRSMAEVSVDRMQAATSPMPPTGAAAADTTVLAAWVKAGTPKGSCADAPISAAPDTTYDTSFVCTSGTTWTRGNRGSTQMHPGVACINCHSSGNGPGYSVAGTLYPTAHEPDDCNGTPAAGANVVIKDASGTAFTLPVNSVGNFYLGKSIRMPYTASIVSGGKTRAMVSAQTDGDCNGCHTESGTNKAPGRLLAP